MVNNRRLPVSNEGPINFKELHFKLPFRPIVGSHLRLQGRLIVSEAKSNSMEIDDCQRRATVLKEGGPVINFTL